MITDYIIIKPEDLPYVVMWGFIAFTLLGWVTQMIIHMGDKYDITIEEIARYSDESKRMREPFVDFRSHL